MKRMLLKIKTSKVCARTEGKRSEKLLYFFLACVTIRTNFLKCFAVRAVWNAPQPQISGINVVSNLI